MASHLRFVGRSVGFCLSALVLSHVFSSSATAQADPIATEHRERLRELERERLLRDLGQGLENLEHMPSADADLQITPLGKPNGFQTSGTTGGFSLNWSY